jgi:hypothetical protein
MLALNIINRSFTELLLPLDYGQVAPILFLFFEKIFASIWTNSEYGLRLFPLLCYGSATFFFYKIITQHIIDKHAKIVAAALFAFGYMFIVYSGELKQYMTDVMVMVAMFWITTKNYVNEHNKYVTAGLAGTVAIFLSNIAPVVLLTCGICALYEQIRGNYTKNIRPLVGVAVIWMTAFLICYLAFIHNHPAKAFMTAFWNYSFPPTNPIQADFYQFLFKRAPLTAFAPLFALSVLKTRTLIAVFPIVVLFVLGLVKVMKNKQVTLLIFLCLPLLIHLTLSALQLYPFERRLILYTLPGIAIGFAIGFGKLMDIGLNKMQKAKPVVTGFTVILIFAQLVTRFPVRYADYRCCMKLAQEYDNGKLLIYPNLSTSSILLYYKTIGLSQHELHPICYDYLSNASYWMINDHRDEDYVDKVSSTLNGQSWLLLGGKGEDIILQLEKLGVTVLDKFEDKGAIIYLVEKKKTTFDNGVKITN